MKTFHASKAAVSLLVSSLALGWVAGGCASSSGGSSVPKPGSGIAEYRKVAREAHRSVAAAVKSLEALAPPNAQSSTSPPVPADREAFRKELDGLTAHGRRVLQALESVSTALDEADVELRKTLASKP